MKKKIYMIGNAHLDPVWMWRWQEGCSEAKATLRSALDRINEYPDFIFTCGAAQIFKWVEETAPEMFKEIQARVREGKIRIVGGWWVQPDCNLPSGESFCRHALYSQRYFYEKFGRIASVGYNVDSFGHNNNIPQLLRKAGMDSYVFMRPMKHEKKLSSNIFTWQSPDGSEVTVFRIPIAYTFNASEKANIMGHIERVCAESDAGIEEMMVFYGVGNHGGGPTKLNLQFIKETQDEGGDTEIIFASPEEFFADIRKKGYTLKVHTDDLQHHASGCYSAYSPIKKLNRQCENRLLAAEKYALISTVLTGMDYPLSELNKAWEDTLFIQFHDSLGGCSIEPVYADVGEFGAGALSTAAHISNRAWQRIAWNADTSVCPEGSYPFVVFNPNAWDVRQPLSVNLDARVYDTSGAELPSQWVQSPVKTCYGRDDTLFTAEIPAMGYKIYYLANRKMRYAKAPELNGIYLDNGLIRVTFDELLGSISGIEDKSLKKQYLSAPCRARVADETECDTWGHDKNFYNNFIGSFKGESLKVLENGPVRFSVKSVSRYKDSTLTQVFSLYAGERTVHVSAKLDWQEKHKLAKLEFPVNTSSPRVIYETPYSFIERPCDGEEEPAQKWVALFGAELGLALLNDSRYSFSAEGSNLRMLAVRSPLFADHGQPRSDECRFSDIGVTSFSYALMPFEGKPDKADLARKALELNSPLEYLFESRHSGKLPTSFEFARVDTGNVILTVFKPAQDGRGYVVRAYEACGEKIKVKFSLDLLGTEFYAEFSPYEIKTFRLNENGKLEGEIPVTEL